jgi:hypothetical protein
MNCLLQLASTVILSISISQVAGIIGMIYWCLVQGLTLARQMLYHLSHSASLSALAIFEIGSLVPPPSLA